MIDRDTDPKQRTLQQNRALHKWFELLADNLNTAGLDMRKTLKESVEIPWSADTVKEYMFKPIMKAQLDKTSTTQLTTKEIDLVFDTITKYLGEKHGVYQDFPTIEALLHEKQSREK